MFLSYSLFIFLLVIQQYYYDIGVVVDYDIVLQLVGQDRCVKHDFRHGDIDHVHQCTLQNRFKII